MRRTVWTRSATWSDDQTFILKRKKSLQASSRKCLPVGTIVSKTYCTNKLFMHTYVQIPYADSYYWLLQHTHKSIWQQKVGSVGFGAVFQRKTACWNGRTQTHTHTHNCTIIFTSNIGEVMALWAISLSSSAVEVHRKRFQSLIVEQKSHSRLTDRYLSQRYTASDKMQHESFAVHTPITATDDGLYTSKGHYDESKKKKKKSEAWGIIDRVWLKNGKQTARLVLSVNKLLLSVSTSYLGFYRFWLLSFCWSCTELFSIPLRLVTNSWPNNSRQQR